MIVDLDANGHEIERVVGQKVGIGIEELLLVEERRAEYAHFFVVTIVLERLRVVVHVAVGVTVGQTVVLARKYLDAAHHVYVQARLAVQCIRGHFVVIGTYENFSHTNRSNIWLSIKSNLKKKYLIL